MTPEQRRLLARLRDPEQPPAARAAAGQRLALIGDPRPGVGLRGDGLPDIAWVWLRGGTFPIGGDEEACGSLPAQSVTLPSFWLARYPVTNAQWRAFVGAGDGYDDDRWWAGLARGRQPHVEPRWGIANHPRERVNWYQAVAFCRWLTARLGVEVRLPTEIEWERAARGGRGAAGGPERGRFYPWGDGYVSWCANIDENWVVRRRPLSFLQSTSPVGIYPEGATPEGICDLVGNVWEWTASPGSGSEIDITNGVARVLRGGSWGSGPAQARAAARFATLPLNRHDHWGFRLASPAPSGGREELC